MSLTFTYESLPGRVIFSPDSARTLLAAEIERMGLNRIMLIATDRETHLASELTKPFSEKIVTVFDRVLPHVPSEVADEARAAASAHGVDGLLSVGGGSTTGTAKIVALTTGLPIVAVPTTYAGSEMTPVWGMTTAARKETGRDMRVLPKVVLYDPNLLSTLPASLAVSSALNAMAHCVEALWTPSANPVTSLQAVEGARALSAGIRKAAAKDDSATSDLLYGAYLAGASFAVAGSGLHHKICHALGGAFNLPHAETHAVVLPRVLAFNAEAVPTEFAALADAFGAEDAVEGLAGLYATAGAPESLQSLGLRQDQLEEAIDVVSDKLPIDNPRMVDRAAITDILTSAFEGKDLR